MVVPIESLMLVPIPHVLIRPTHQEKIKMSPILQQAVATFHPLRGVLGSGLKLMMGTSQSTWDVSVGLYAGVGFRAAGD